MRWRWTLVSGLSLLPLWASALRAEEPVAEPPATIPATAPATQPVAAEPEEHMPVTDAKTIQSLVKLSVENKMLRMSSDLPPTPEPTLVRVANFPGRTVAVVRTADAPAGGEPQSPATISIRHEM